MSKALTLIAFLILLIIGGRILFPRRHPQPENVPLNTHGDTMPAKATMVGPQNPPPVK
jgi:hypothetical protein